MRCLPDVTCYKLPIKVQEIGEDMPNNMFLLSILNYGAILNILLGLPNHES